MRLPGLAHLFPKGDSEKAPLRGAPEVRRIKTYQAESGYVYQYYFDGWRAATGGREYVFEVTTDRETYRSVLVWVEDCALMDSELHAAAKIALFRSFDTAESPRHLGPIRIAAAEAHDILRQLGRIE